MATTEKPKSKKRIINIRQLKQKKYTEVDLGPYAKVLGEIDGKTTIMVYGPSGSGKSVWVLKLVNYLAQKYGKVLYNSHEESLNKTLQSRVNNYNIDSEKVYFGDSLDFEEMTHKVKVNKYRVVVVDSVQYMKFTYEQLIEFKEAFKRRNVVFIMVSFGTTLGKTDGADKLLHASDGKIHIKHGRLTSHGRHIEKPYEEVLFKLNVKGLGGLFE